jgi:small ligand-binding sensory domain FIST
VVNGTVQRAGAEANGALYFSCVARGPNLFGPDAEEVRLLSSGLGAVPLAGFYANGEISNNKLYSHTGVLVLFR